MKQDQPIPRTQHHEPQLASNGEPNPIETRKEQDTSPGTRQHRRRLLQAVTAAGIGGATTLPTHWSRPVVDSVLLPAHAQATPVVSNPACLLTCTRAFTEIVFIGPQEVVGIARTALEQCMSQNGEFSSTGSNTTTVGVTAFSDFTLSTGTFSTFFTLSSLAGTSSNVTVFFTSSTENFQQSC